MKIPTMNKIFNLAIKVIVIILTYLLLPCCLLACFIRFGGLRNYYLQSLSANRSMSSSSIF